MQIIGLLFPPAEPQSALLIGGIPVLERQARQLRRAGVTRIIVVDAVPLQTLPAGVETVSSRQVAASLGANTTVICIAAGLVIDERVIAAMLAAPAPALLVSTAAAMPGAFVERLDQTHVYMGLCLLDGAMIARVAAAIGEWDLGATLVRAAAADPAAARIDLARLPIYAPARRRNLPMLWFLPGDAAAARLADAANLAAAQKGCLDWPARFIHPFIEDTLVRLLAPTPITPNMVTLATGVIGVVAGIAFATGWLWTGLILALITCPLDGVDGKLARARVEFSKWGDHEHLLDKVLEYGWYLAIAAHFSVVRESALPFAIAALIVLPAIAEAIQGEFFRRMTGVQLDDAGATERGIRLVAGRRNTFLWAWLGFALAGLWFEGFVMLAVYSVLTTGIAQWRFYVRLSAYGIDHGEKIAANYSTTRVAFLPPDPL